MQRKGFLELLGTIGAGSFITGFSAAKLSPGELIKPNRLEKGDTIGLISPGSRLHKKERYGEIIDQVKDLGYEVKVGDNAKNRYGYMAGRDKERADDVNAMFADDSVDAILPFRGGWGCNRILHLIDYELIRENPKILVGFSDITSLLLSIYAKTGLVTFHGPVGKSDWKPFTTRNFRNTLSYQQQNTLNLPADDFCEDCNSFYVISPGKAAGRLVGGNLSVLAAMMGSDYLPEWKDSILFLEDVGENIYRIDRMLTQLKLNGVLDQISGFIFGQCTECERSNPYSLTLEQVFDDHIKPLGIPAFSGAMFGHIENMITLPVGVPARINAQTGTISLTEAATV